MRKRLIVLALTLAGTGNAVAQPSKRPTKVEDGKKATQSKGLSKADLERLTKALESGTEAETIAALQEIRGLGAAAGTAAPLIEGLLARGSSAAVIVAACDAAGAVGAESTSAALAPYVQHRKTELRQASARAIARTKGPLAVRTLQRALGSPDPAVRAIAAESLGKLGAKGAVEDLFTVLAHDTPGAARSIAELCHPAQCDRLMALVGKLKFETLEPAFVPLLTRPSTEVPEAQQLRYIDRLRRLATPAAQAVLTAALADLREDASPKVRRALEAASKGRPAPEEAP